MKLAIRIGMVVLGLLLIGGGGFAGWRYFRPQEGGTRAAAKARGDAKAQAAATTPKGPGEAAPSKPGASGTPQTTSAPSAQAVEKPAVSAPEKAPAVAPPPAPGPGPGAEKPAVGAQEKAGAAPNSRDAEQERLIRVYGGMKPKEAAAVMGQLDPALSVTILAGLQERQASKILGQLPPKTAAELITRLSQVKRAPDADPPPRRPHAGGKS